MIQWHETNLEEVCEIITDGTHYSPVNGSIGDFKYITSKNIRPYRLDLSDITYISQEVHAEIYKRCSPKKGDVLYVKDGVNTGTAAINHLDEAFSMLSSVALIRPKANLLDASYLMHWLMSPEAHRRMMKNMSGTAIRRLILREIKQSRLPLPPLEEQHRIAAILDKASAIRRKREEAIKLTEGLLRATFLDMFGNPVTNPKRWQIKPLIELIDSKRPITYGILKPGENIESGIPYVRVVEMKNGTVNSSIVRRTSPEIAKQYSRSTLKAGDLLLSIRGHVGRLAITPLELNGANITQDTARLAVGNLLTTEFLFSLLDSQQMQNWMIQRMKGVGVKGINLADVKEIPTLVPPISLQEKFSAIFYNVHSQQEKDKNREFYINNLFNSLLHRAFRGEL